MASQKPVNAGLRRITPLPYFQTLATRQPDWDCFHRDSARLNAVE
jgi:hypothetical protein